MLPVDKQELIPTEDVCVADERKYICIVRDLVDTKCPTRKTTLNLPASTRIADFIKDVAKATEYNADTISVHYECDTPTGETQELDLREHLDRSLTEINQAQTENTCRRPRLNFTIHEKEPGVLPQKLQAETSTSTTPSSDFTSRCTVGSKATCGNTSVEDTGASTSVNLDVSGSNTYSPYTSSSSLPLYTSDYTYSYSAAIMKSDTGYVGLVNQAMTCYLNSLLQTLYMTPEFRNALYRWEFDGTEAEMVKSIPCHLQKLFLQLQTSKKRAVETTDLTKSFGWDSSEAWQQHDVQELCRVMFDALELKWRNTDQAHLINHLYQGKMKDYVKCLECSTESARIDAYLDIPLVIRPFGSNKAYGTVDEALRAFVQPEILDSTNQYFCEKCGKKCDAHKGLKFVSFPYLLTLQLKRFDFDYNTMHRIKLNDRMTFPDTLDINHLLSDCDEGGGGGESNGISAGYHGDDEHNCDETENNEMHEYCRAARQNGSTSLGGHTSSAWENGDDEGIDEGIDMGNCASGTSTTSESSSDCSEAATNDRNTKASEFKGPYVYELFSIMIHSGSAAGGHYYAYIKSFKDGQWYSFNDQHVTKISYDDIRKTYGGSTGFRGYYTAAYASSINAYMLMYRQIDKKRNTDFMSPVDFPSHLTTELQYVKNKEAAEKLLREIERCTCKIKLYCYHPITKQKMDIRLEIHKDKTLREATEWCWRLFDLRKVISLGCCRLIMYDDYHDSLERSFENEDDTTMEKLLNGVKSSYTFDLLLETRKPEQKFQEYKTGGVTVKVYIADLMNDVILPPATVRAYQTQTMYEFKHLLSQTLDIPVEYMKCVLERSQNDLRLLSIPNKTLKAEGFFRSNKVFIEYSGIEDLSLPFPETQFYQLCDRHQNTINITVSLPSQAEVDQLLESASQEHDSADYAHVVLCAKKMSSSMCADATDSLDEGIGDSKLDLNIHSNGSLHSSLSDPCLYQSCHSDNKTNCSAKTGSSPPRWAFTSSTDTRVVNEGGGGVQSSDNNGVGVTSVESIITISLPSTTSSTSLHKQSTSDLTEDVHMTDSVNTTNTDSSVTFTINLPSNSPSNRIIHKQASLSDLSRIDPDPDSPTMDPESPDLDLESPVNNSCSDSERASVSGDDEGTEALKASAERVSRIENWDIHIPCTSSQDPVIYDQTDDDPAANVIETEDWDAEIEAEAMTGSSSSSSFRRKTFISNSAAQCTASSGVSSNSLQVDDSDSSDEEEYRKYFRALEFTDQETGQRGLHVSIDKRISMKSLKKELQHYVGTNTENFKVYRVYPNNHEIESTRLSENLTYLEDGKLNIKIGRALKPGEYRVKVYQLLINDAEPCKFLIDTIFAKGMTVLQSKKLVLAEVKKHCDLDIPLNRCRLRKKTLKNPYAIYLDNQVYEDSITIFPNWEIFLEVLESHETIQSTSQLALYTKRWCPAKYEFEQFKEVILSQQTVYHLKEKLSEISHIPEENIEIAKGRGSFPCEVSVLEAQTDLDWNPQATTLASWPMYISEDGHVIYYRDRTEELMELTEDRRKEIQQKDSARMVRSSPRVAYSPRKERALKIYTDDVPPAPAGNVLLHL